MVAYFVDDYCFRAQREVHAKSHDENGLKLETFVQYF